MKVRTGFSSYSLRLLVRGFAAQAQDLVRGFTSQGRYLHFRPDQGTTTCSFVVTEAGVVMIDSCSSPLDSRRMAAAIKKVTDKQVTFLIVPNPLRPYRNHFIFSPPATVINAERATRKRHPKRAETLRRNLPKCARR